MSSISVVVPVLNDASHLRLLLRALNSQTRAANEIIIVDNGCSDDSADIARQHGARVIKEPRPGIPAAAAAGYDAAVNEIIVRCDADTQPAAHWLEQIAGRFEDPGLDALTGPGRFYDVPHGLRWVLSLFYSAFYFLGLGGALARVPLWGSNMAFRRSLWPAVSQQLNRENRDIHDDLDFSCKLPADCRIYFDRSLTVGAAGRIFARRAGVVNSTAMALRTLGVNGGAQGVMRRWQHRLGL